MTSLSKRIVLIAVSVGALSGCIEARSQYAPYEGYQSPSPSSPAKPRYPVRADQPQPAAPAASEGDADRPAAAPTHGVDATPLPPPSPAQFLDPAVYSSTDDQPVELILASSRSRAARRAEARRAEERQAEAQRSEKRGSRRSRAKQEKADALVRATGRVEAGSGRTHEIVVKKGDTIEVIADRLQISKEAIIKANRLRRPYRLDVGQTLKVPTSKAYVVEHGDTLYAISRRFGVPVPELEDLNHLEHGAHLHLGQRVALPGQPAEEAVVEATPEARPKPTPKPPRRLRGAQSPAGSVAESMQRSAFPPPGQAPEPQPWSPPPVPAQPAPMTPAPQPSSRPARVAPAVPSEPTHGPIPYTSLPGHLTGPALGPSAGGMTEQPSYGSPSMRGTAPQSSYGSPPVRGMTPQAPNGPPVIEAAPPPTDAQIAAAGRGRFTWPVRGDTISGFGPKAGGQRNDGVDIAAAMDAPVHASAAGDIVYAGNQVPGFGNLVLIKHADGWVTAYAHLSTTEVRIKDHVSQGAEIGRVGQTGGAVQPELHFEIRYAPTPRDKARPVDPALLLGDQ